MLVCTCALAEAQDRVDRGLARERRLRQPQGLPGS